MLVTNRVRMTLGVLTLAILAPVLAPTAAFAEPNPYVSEWNEVDIINKSKTTNVVRYDQLLGKCGGYVTAQECAVTSNKTVSRTIGTDFGLAFGAAAASLGISSERSQAISATCTLRTQPNRYPYVSGYLRGDNYSYTVRHRQWSYGKLVKTETSKQNAFNPLGIACGLSSS